MDDTLKELQRAADCAGLEMEFLELRRDAERYRKLRNSGSVFAPMVVDPMNHAVGYTPEGLDAALDALPEPTK